MSLARQRLLAEHVALVERVRNLFPDRWSPEITAASYLISQVEDRMLEIICRCVREVGLAVRAYIFDGVLVANTVHSRDAAVAPNPDVVEQARAAAQQRIAAAFPFDSLVLVHTEACPFEEVKRTMERPRPWVGSHLGHQLRCFWCASLHAFSACLNEFLLAAAIVDADTLAFIERLAASLSLATSTSVRGMQSVRGPSWRSRLAWRRGSQEPPTCERLVVSAYR